jgi:alkylation response protein AidB-like acyl-CoA dehydrogenase
MRWSLDDEQQMLAEALADWLDDVASSADVRTALDAGDPSDFEAALAEGGWCALGVDEALGGQGGGLTELALLAEALGAHAAPSSAWLATALALPALAGDEDLRTSALEGGFAALCVPGDRPLDAETDAVAADGARLTGEVPLVLGADRAQLLVVPATDAAGTRRLWAVAADAEGVEVSPATLLDRSRTAARVSLHGAAARQLTADAADVLAGASSRAAVLIAADALGAATRMRALAVAYAGQRTQFGHPIAAFQAVKHAAAQLVVAEEAGRSLVYYAAATVDAQAPEHAEHAAAAKAQVGAASAHAADTALTLHGAIGYTWEHDLQLFYKRAKLDAELFGTASVWNERIARALALV